MEKVKKYKMLIYTDPGVPIPLPKSFLRDYSILGMDVEGPRLALNEVAKYAASKLAYKALVKGELARERLSREWLKLSQELMEKWMDEVVKDLILGYPL